MFQKEGREEKRVLYLWLLGLSEEGEWSSHCDASGKILAESSIPAEGFSFTVIADQLLLILSLPKHLCLFSYLKPSTPSKTY